MVKFLDSAGLSALWNKIKSTFYTKTELSNLVTHSQSSTISGDLTPEAAAQVVTVAPQSFTDAQKAQARSNIGVDTLVGNIETLLAAI